jgi:hypothetical protein
MADGAGFQLMPTRFTAEDAGRAYDEWTANCGPGAVAAIMDMSLDEVRPFFAAAGFDAKRYTNPTMMNDILRAIGRPWRKIGREWPRWGLVRVQWEGPWTEPGVPMRVRYRHTHWIGAAQGKHSRGIFDINMISNGTGWASQHDWETLLVPWLLGEVSPGNYGTWHVTHAIEVERVPRGQGTSHSMPERADD